MGKISEDVLLNHLSTHTHERPTIIAMTNGFSVDWAQVLWDGSSRGLRDQPHAQPRDQRDLACCHAFLAKHSINVCAVLTRRAVLAAWSHRCRKRRRQR